MWQGPQTHVALSSLDIISRLSFTSGNHSCGGKCGKDSVGVLGYGNRPLLRSRIEIQTSWQRFSDAETDHCVAFDVGSRVSSLPMFYTERLREIEKHDVNTSTENWLLMGLHRWAAGVFIASALLGSPAAAAAEVMSLAMLDSEITTGPITEFLLSSQEEQARNEFSEKVSEAVEWLEKGQLAQARGDFSAALNCFTEVTEKAGDLALAEYARVGHAVTLYEVGDRGQAIIEMEDVSISLKGYPEIHAALAAALYADKNAPIPAEKQFTIATLLDPRYTDLVWVQETKHWPPSLLKSLQRFISLN